MNYEARAFSLLPRGLCDAPERFTGSPIEEIRLRLGRPPSVLRAGKESPLSKSSVTRRDITAVLEKATDASLHAALPALSEGYVSYRGLRIGVCGTGVIKNGVLNGFRDFSSLNIRIPAQFQGEIGEILETLTHTAGSALIVSPPGGGKTTLLRELIRCLSDSGIRIAVVDERYELQAKGDGEDLGFDLGSHSDVMSGVKKSQAAMMLLRGMNPGMIAMDEITETADLAAIREINGCGVALLATAHAANAAALGKRALYRKLLSERIFQYAIEISGKGGARKASLRRLGE